MIFFLGTKNVGFDGVHLASKFSDALLLLVVQKLLVILEAFV